MKVDWRKIPERGLPDCCSIVCWIHNISDNCVWLDQRCYIGAYSGQDELYYATAQIPAPPQPEPENPPKPDKPPKGYEFTGECRRPKNEVWLDIFEARIPKPANSFLNTGVYDGRRWILRKVDPPERDRDYMQKVLSKIRDVVDESIEELG